MVGVEGRFGGVPRGFARRSLGVGYDIRRMLREEPFLRWLFSCEGKETIVVVAGCEAAPFEGRIRSVRSSF